MNILPSDSPGTRDLHCTVVVKIREFSNVTLHKPDEDPVLECIDYYMSSVDFKLTYVVVAYPNGYDSSTEGSVSVIFRSLTNSRRLDGFQHDELICTIAVIDAEGSRRFQQSFVISHDHLSIAKAGIPIDNYLSRGTLLKERSEFLPGDTLTLHLDLILREHRFGRVDSGDAGYSDCFRVRDSRKKKGLGTVERYLRLDSSVARRLVEESEFFRRILDTPMLEKSSGLMKIPDGEFGSFKYIRSLLLGCSAFTVFSVSSISDLYTTADKYGIPSIIRTCRCWLKLCLCRQNALDVSDFANRFNDGILIEAVQDLLGKGEGRYVVEDDFEARTSEEWTYHPNKDWREPFYFTRYYRLADETGSKLGDENETSEKRFFDFYL